MKFKSLRHSPSILWGPKGPMGLKGSSTGWISGWLRPPAWPVCYSASCAPWQPWSFKPGAGDGGRRRPCFTIFHHSFFWILRDLRVILQMCHLQDFGKPFWHFSFCEILGIMFDNFFFGSGQHFTLLSLQGAAAEHCGHLAHRTLAAAAASTLGLPSSGDFQGLETW